MFWPDGSPILMHASNLPYDPQKAHDYYELHKKLHPRAPGAGTYRVKSTRTGGTVKLSAKELEEQKIYASARVTQIKKNLSDLGVLLRDKVTAAKAAADKAAKPPTLAEKAATARAAKKYAASHKTEIANKAKTAAAKAPAKAAPAAKTDTVDSLKKEITTAKANLKDAVAKQRELATAKKNG